MNSFDIKSSIKEAIELAETWQKQANTLITFSENNFQKKIARLLNETTDKVLVTRIIDQSFRSTHSGRVAHQLISLLKNNGIPTFVTFLEKMLIIMFISMGRLFSPISIPVLIKGIKKESSRVILPGEKKPLLTHLKNRKTDGVQININHLGEAVLGEDEAGARLKTYMADLENPEIENISIKISTIYSQILSIDFDHTVEVLVERLSTLYRSAINNAYISKNKTKVHKLVNLDMEEYRDLDITASAFMQTLDKEEFKNYSGGIVLQSYLPDSYNMQKKITSWAKQRMDNGGSPIRLRIVKGANLEMEKVSAAISNWPLSTYDNKLDVDANYKRMVFYGMHPENIKAINLGIASHNLFELAFANQLARFYNVQNYFSFEMLEGMADHVRRAIGHTSGKFLLYAPVATKDQFTNAIAYLIRRLDENTADENFLRYACDLKPDSSEWSFLKKQFVASCHHMDMVDKTPYRIQDRTRENTDKKEGTFHNGIFFNEPDTDWALLANQKWAGSIRIKWKKEPHDKPMTIPIVVAGNEIYENRQILQAFDSSQVGSRNTSKICVAMCALSNETDVDMAVKTAKTDSSGWRKMDAKDRWKILSKVASELRDARGDLIGAAAGTGKIFTESDVEVSEAIDFAEYYPYSINFFSNMSNLKCTAKGVGVVIAPWNFPIAIPCGGIMAGLSAGNTVILKPASAAILPAFLLCRCFWKAGVPKNVLQFLPLEGSSTGRVLTAHEHVDFFIFTGSTETGLSILKGRPDTLFAGETGGKNSTIVTAMSDRDQAIHNVVQSAFGNSGQKCSATSLLILEKEVFEDKNFKRQLIDAAKSVATGSVWDFKNRMGPLIAPPEKDLKKALRSLEPNEEWALKPVNIDNNPYLWSPCIKWNVMPGSSTHMTEFFGPVLGVIKADDLAHAVALSNQTGYGLTAGLESLDLTEQEYWKKNINAGNLYINRGTTGAVVLRQPFGGLGKSSIGSGIKAGGPNYAVQFMDIEETGFPEISFCTKNHPLLQVASLWELRLGNGDFKEHKHDLNKTILAIRSYISAFESEFSKEKDFFHIRGQDNIFRYHPIGKVLIRLHPEDTLFDTLARIAGSIISGCTPLISIPHSLKNKITRFLSGKEGKRYIGESSVTYQNDDDIVKMMDKIQRIRYGATDRVPLTVLTAAAQTGFYISRNKVFMEGRIELLQYMREQSICNNYHRYGNLGERTKEFPI